jgi:hypothetical protein
MPLVLRKVFRWRRPRIFPGLGKTANEDIQLVHSRRGGPAPTPAVNSFELELVEERAKRARLEHEYQRVKAEADAFAQANGKLEDEIQQVKVSLEAREKDLAHKDTSLRRLEKDMSEIQTKVGRVESEVGSMADVFCTIPPEACRVTNGGRTCSKTIRTVIRNGQSTFGEVDRAERCTGIPHQGRRRFRGRGGGYD